MVSVAGRSLLASRSGRQKAVPFIDDGYLNLQVWRKEDAGGITDEIRFGIAVSIEAEGAIPIYDEIAQRLRVAPRP
jgi:hypothetical protein